MRAIAGQVSGKNCTAACVKMSWPFPPNPTTFCDKMRRKTIIWILWPSFRALWHVMNVMVAVTTNCDEILAIPFWPSPFWKPPIQTFSGMSGLGWKHFKGHSVEHSGWGFPVLDFCVFQGRVRADTVKLPCSARKPCFGYPSCCCTAQDFSSCQNLDWRPGFYTAGSETTPRFRDLS